MLTIRNKSLNLGDSGGSMTIDYRKMKGKGQRPRGFDHKAT